MLRHLLFAGTCLLAAFTMATAHAAKSATPKEQLEKDATHIIVGKVQSISSTTQRYGKYDIANDVAAIVVAELEKGVGLKAGDIIHGRISGRCG
jgi:hypothetical protein